MMSALRIFIGQNSYMYIYDKQKKKNYLVIEIVCTFISAVKKNYFDVQFSLIAYRAFIIYYCACFVEQYKVWHVIICQIYYIEQK